MRDNSLVTFSEYCGGSDTTWKYRCAMPTVSMVISLKVANPVTGLKATIDVEVKEPPYVVPVTMETLTYH